MNRPLAERIRPDSLDEIVGQTHLLAKDKILYKILSSGNIPNMIFYGPSGTGKTTIANIAAKVTNKKLFKLNGTTATTADIKQIASQLDTLLTMNGILLYLDEIQYFNKKQQQLLLDYIEKGKITLIASTTENPYFYIYNAILSRCSIFEFYPISPDDVKKALKRGIELIKADFPNIKFLEDALEHMSNVAGGDVRKALNSMELAVLAAYPDGTVDLEVAQQCTQKKSMRYDRDGDSHYDILSAFQKSIRGSDPDASIHYLARLVSAGDLPSICRRLLVIASEDIGLAYPIAVAVVKACVDSALQLGFPEARIPLAQAVLLLANSPKSNSTIMAIDQAINDIEKKDVGDIPFHLKDSHYPGSDKLGRGIEYLYPHNFPNNYIFQQYLPDNLAGAKYYQPGNNKNEMATAVYMDKLKKGKGE